jgi:hypothetical protein
LLAALAALLAGGGMAVLIFHVRGRRVGEEPSAAAPRNPGGGPSSGFTRPPVVPPVPPGWQEIRSPEGRFTVAMPAGAFERKRTMSSRVGPVRDKAYLHELQGEVLNYMAAYADFTEEQLRRASLEDIIRDGRDAIIQTYGGNLESERAIHLNGHRGREIVIGVPGRGKFVYRYYAVPPRLYTLGVAGSKATLESEEVQAFFHSFHLLEGRP